MQQCPDGLISSSVNGRQGFGVSASTNQCKRPTITTNILLANDAISFVPDFPAPYEAVEMYLQSDLRDV